MFQYHIQLSELLAELFSPLLGVVIHDLSTNKIAFITGELSQRKVGDDSLLDLSNLNSFEEVTKVYIKHSYNGYEIKSASIPIVKDGENVGLMCFNFDISIFHQIKAIADRTLAIQSENKPKLLFKNDWQERVHEFLYKTSQEKGYSLQALNNQQKYELLKMLHSEGAFNEKKAPDYIAKILNIGRATIFNYLRQWRKA